MKRNYEDRTKLYLPRRTYTLIRLDMKSGHQYTKRISAPMPFDDRLMSRMDLTAKFLCANIQGAQFAYVQSDEISILLTDFDGKRTQAWFDGNVQKIVSVSASMAGAFFNSVPSGIYPDKVYEHVDKFKDNTVEDWVLLADRELAFFDSRVFTIPDPVEVYNYFVWRIQDWERNSLQMLARKYFPDQKDLNGKNEHELHQMIHAAGDNWAKLPETHKRGRILSKHIAGMWNVYPAPLLSDQAQKEAFKALIPIHGYGD